MINLMSVLTDGVPTMVPETLGYHHQYVCLTSPTCQTTRTPMVVHMSIGNSKNQVGLSAFRHSGSDAYHVCVWIANSSTIRRCEGQEDPECSHSIRKSRAFICAVVLNWFRSIDRNQSGAHSLLWTGYVQHLGNVVYLLLMKNFHLL